MEFCSEEELLKVLVDGDKKTFDEILSRVFMQAVEKSLLLMPEAVDKLGKRLAYTQKLFGEFLEKHPAYLEEKELVVEVVQSVEMKNPADTFEDILKKSEPLIEERLRLLKTLKEK
jgi:hypothetical protein